MSDKSSSGNGDSMARYMVAVASQKMDNWSANSSDDPVTTGEYGTQRRSSSLILRRPTDVRKPGALKMDPARTEGSEGSSVYSSVNSGRSGVHTGSAKRDGLCTGARARGEAHARSDD